MPIAEFAMPTGISSVGRARHAVRDALHGLGLILSQEDTDVVMLLTSELVTNAIVHAVGGSEIELSVRADVGTLRVTVTDHGTGTPQLRTAAESDQGGRGLALVKALAHDFGWDRLDDGKQVWFELSLDNDDSGWPGASMANTRPGAVPANSARRSGTSAPEPRPKAVVCRYLGHPDFTWTYPMAAA
ncbi:ATP-binding protein [Kitasatospora sp. NPDC093558]|uniref:ATP-binding protein n=1 Tax=Kitasatospora sp. NPDC093558 TaxID=3155201 RepID=UPI00342B604C